MSCEYPVRIVTWVRRVMKNYCCVMRSWQVAGGSVKAAISCKLKPGLLRKNSILIIGQSSGQPYLSVQFRTNSYRLPMLRFC